MWDTCVYGLPTVMVKAILAFVPVGRVKAVDFIQEVRRRWT